jgi:hypothetical protein
MKSASRKFFAVVLTVLASVAMFVTLLALYANHTLVNSSGFSDRAVTLAHTGAVDALIVDTVTNRLMADVGNEATLQPIIQDGVREVLSSAQISAAIRTAAASLQSELVSGHANSLTLTLPDLGSSIASNIKSTSPQLAAVVGRIGTVTVLDVPIPSSAARAIRTVSTVGRDSILLLILTVALAALALIITPDRGRTLIGLGLGAFASGLLAAAAYFVGSGVVVNEFSSQDARTAAQTAWNVYMGGLKTWGFVLAGIGAVTACVAALI